jgi:hypothetical protein
MLKRFFDDRAYKSIDKDLRCYFRVTEPHKDGTPHIHMSLFIPEDKKERIVKALKRLYPAPLGKVETNIRKPVHYLMKYVLKTFDDLRDDKNISNLTLWYLYHGISRFYTSRTFINLEIYRKLNGLYELKELSEKYRREEIQVYFYKDTDKLCLIENEFGTLYVPKPIDIEEQIDMRDRIGAVYFNHVYDSLYIPKSFNIKQKFIFRENLEDFKPTILLESEFKPLSKPKPKKPLPVVIDDVEHLYIDGKIYRPTKKPYQMNDMELYEYFNELDIDTVDDKHYIYTRNLLVERGLIEGEWLKLTALQDLMEEIELEGAF